ncbi:MAG: tRNA (adenosine(37)-N6)-threonylcarbamoyltransferase complex ATPase subunit type 1 TsaE [Planctomycetota bacterium]
MIEVRRLCESALHTEALARGLAAVLRAGDRVALSGEMGAGKTTFVRGLAAGLGGDQRLVSSPTFVTVNIYPLTGCTPDAPAELVHADFFRLTGDSDLDALGWDRLVHPRSVVVAEWPTHAPGALGDSASVAQVSLSVAGEESREITLALPNAWSSRTPVALLVANLPTVCRVTGRPVAPTSPTYPFFDERAKMADLGRWLSGGYSLSRDAEASDFEEGAG